MQVVDDFQRVSFSLLLCHTLESLVSFEAYDFTTDQGGRYIGIAMETGMEFSTAIDLNKNACAALKKQHPSTNVICGSVNEELDAVLENSNFDVVTAGFPCQTFSFANRFGKGDSLEYLYVLKTIALAKPSFVVLENVAAFARARVSENDETGSIPGGIIQFLLNLGYQLRIMIVSAFVHFRSRFIVFTDKSLLPQLNAASFGASQNRNRWFLVVS
jgi:site-specific DNA-cytosine methylase